jgi:ribosomal protein S18 acetylase RimI-like enzyme
MDGAGSTASAELTLTLSIRDLTEDDLPECGWSGTPLHRKTVADELRRAAAGEVDYLVICLPSGAPVAIGEVDFVPIPDAGYLCQLAVNPALQRCGIGTVLVRALEDRILRRGRTRAELGYEEKNAGNRAFYERLGYTAYGTVRDGWNEELPNGEVQWYATTCVEMRRDLSPKAAG